MQTVQQQEHSPVPVAASMCSRCPTVERSVLHLRGGCCCPRRQPHLIRSQLHLLQLLDSVSREPTHPGLNNCGSLFLPSRSTPPHPCHRISLLHSNHASYARGLQLSFIILYFFLRHPTRLPYGSPQERQKSEKKSVEFQQHIDIFMDQVDWLVVQDTNSPFT